MRASTRLNLFQRLLNRVGRPLGILPFPFVWEPDAAAPTSRERVFDRIFQANTWNSFESPSGPGSELSRTEKYRRALIEFLRRTNASSMFDAPCGDLNWMGEVLSEVPIRYIGGDVSDLVLDRVRQRYPELDLRHFDICRDEFPEVQLWHCRDTFLHLSFADIWAALENAARSNIEYALLTSHRARYLRNLDVRTGGARPLDLERAPFSFPPPLEYLAEFSGRGFPRAVGVWPIQAIREVAYRAPPPAPSGIRPSSNAYPNRSTSSA